MIWTSTCLSDMASRNNENERMYHGILWFDEESLSLHVQDSGDGTWYQGSEWPEQVFKIHVQTKTKKLHV